MFAKKLSRGEKVVAWILTDQKKKKKICIRVTRE